MEQQRAASQPIMSRYASMLPPTLPAVADEGEAESGLGPTPSTGNLISGARFIMQYTPLLSACFLCPPAEICSPGVIWNRRPDSQEEEEDVALWTKGPAS